MRDKVEKETNVRKIESPTLIQTREHLKETSKHRIFQFSQTIIQILKVNVDKTMGPRILEMSNRRTKLQNRDDRDKAMY